MDIRESTTKIYEIMNSGNFDGLEEVIDANIVDHEEMPGITGSGLEKFRGFTTLMHAAVSDLKITPLDVIVAGDKVVVRGTIAGRHTGDQMGMPATGKSFQIEGIDIMRFEGGKAVEHWGLMDQMGMMAQLGLLPTP
jgi:predicted ester cyclase